MNQLKLGTPQLKLIPMSLPFIVDVAIGLIFIYLILSLLASEIQELLTTFLQWRAKHLKESIEILLSGGVGTKQENHVRELVSKLYNDPLIKNINQEAKGSIERGVRQLSHVVPGNRKGAFGDRQSSGPSYIAPETFATSLLERLGLATLVEKLVEVRLERFAKRIVGEYRFEGDKLNIPTDDELKDKHNWEKGRIRAIAEKSGKVNLDTDENFIELVEEYNDILQAFKTEESTLKTCVERMGESFSAYIAAYPVLPAPDKDSAETTDEDLTCFVRRLKACKTGLFGEANERAILSGGLRPSLSEIAELVNDSSNTYQEAKASFEAIKTQGKALDQKIRHKINSVAASKSEPPPDLDKLDNDDRRLRINEAMTALNLTQSDRTLYDNYITYSSIEKVLKELPNSVKESLAILARRAQIKVQQTGNDLDQFKEEVAHWFDHSMSRASGVYKRNAKGVAILIGLVLAAMTNSDTLHIVGRLSNDEDLRRVVTEQALNMAPNTNADPLTREELNQLREDADAVLKNLSLPIGWEPSTLTQQFNCSSGLHLSQSDPYIKCPRRLSQSTPVFIQLAVAQPVRFFKVFVGWLISGLAISMGASFWFDLLGKLVNVRNSGGKPRSEASRTSQENNP